MNETAGWALAATVASLALLSLGATASMQRDASPAPRTLAHRSAPAAQAREADSAALLADAYFQIARDAPGLEAADESWFLRHELTIKGIAAQRGEDPMPEEPESDKLAPGEVPEFRQAGRLIEDWRARLGAVQPRPAGLARLTARRQVHYDWWLLLAEAGAPRASIDTAHRLFEDARAALTAAAAQSKIAAL
jgi:hypothetical protein